jgi:hypothetical protein
MSWVIKNLVRLKGWPMYRFLERATENPEEVQRSLLLNILKQNAETEFGRKYSFQSIRNEADYQKVIPLQDYDAVEPYIKKSLNGKQHVLTADPVVRYNVTSGTTGNPKYIPITAAFQRLTLQLLQQWLYRSQRDHPRMLDHSLMLITSPAVEGRTQDGTPYGSATGLIYENLPNLLQGSFTIPFLVSRIKDYNLRYYTLARLALERRISFIGTPNPTTLVRVAEAAVHHQDLLIQSVKMGRLCEGNQAFNLGGHEDIITALEENLRPNPDRARFLSNIVEKKGRLRLGDCWPELQMIACWLGGSMGAQVHKLYDHFNQEVPVRDFGYQASEGSFALPFQDQTPSGILALFNGFYEFIPEEEMEKDLSRLLLSHQLEAGRQYSVILTTHSGLYRYRINDIIEVTGWHKNTPLIKFVRKGRDMANLTGEKVHVNQIIEAMNIIMVDLRLSLNQFRVIPNIEKVRYEFYLELNRDLPLEVVRDQVIPGIDRALSRLNIEYLQKRKSLRLNMPSVFIMGQGWEREDRRRFVNSGRKDAQYKWQILSERITPLDQDFILVCIESDQLETPES